MMTGVALERCRGFRALEGPTALQQLIDAVDNPWHMGRHAKIFGWAKSAAHGPLLRHFRHKTISK